MRENNFQNKYMRDIKILKLVPKRILDNVILSWRIENVKWAAG